MCATVSITSAAGVLHPHSCLFHLLSVLGRVRQPPKHGRPNGMRLAESIHIHSLRNELQDNLGQGLILSWSGGESLQLRGSLTPKWSQPFWTLRCLVGPFSSGCFMSNHLGEAPEAGSEGIGVILAFLKSSAQKVLSVSWLSLTSGRVPASFSGCSFIAPSLTSCWDWSSPLFKGMF